MHGVINNMKKYYTGPVKKAVITNVLKNEDTNRFDFDMEISTLCEDVIFYRNFMDVLINDETKFPAILETELFDLFQSSLEIDPTVQYSLIFVDEQDLKRLENKPEESKTLTKTLINKLKSNTK